MDELNEIVRCRRCREEVLAGDICEEHKVCLWCDLECKFTAASEATNDDGE